MSVQIMAIINTSPDSFSGDGVAVADTERLRQRIKRALDEGADLLDIGGQSTRPGAEIVSEATEIARVVPAVKLARKLSANVPISVDTFKPSVAQAALDAGATIINDVTGFRDRRMVLLAAETSCEVVVMHMRGTPQTMSALTDYPNGVIMDVVAFLKTQTDILQAAGVPAQRIIVDPGIGFAKRAAQSFELTRHLSALQELGFRILYGASNKSFLGKALATDGVIAPVPDRAVATVVVQAYAMLHGANIVRVHDIAAAVQTRTVIEALMSQREIMP